jgi:hypothetical protein
MSNTLIILIDLASIIAAVLVTALIMKKRHYVNREIIITAPKQKVFDYLKLLKNQDKWNRNAMAGTERKEEFKGTDGTVGYIYAWSGNKKVGEGEKEIMNIIDGKRIETEIRFVKPMAVTASIIMETESISNDQTRVTLSNAGTLKYPLNIMIPVFEKMFAKDIDASLSNLKTILEK